MDFVILSSMIFGFAFAIVPAMALSLMEGFSGKNFVGYFAAFNSIVVAAGIFPSWMFIVSILSLAVMIYFIVRGDAG